VLHISRRFFGRAVPGREPRFHASQVLATTTTTSRSASRSGGAGRRRTRRGGGTRRYTANKSTRIPLWLMLLDLGGESYDTWDHLRGQQGHHASVRRRIFRRRSARAERKSCRATTRSSTVYCVHDDFFVLVWCRSREGKDHYRNRVARCRVSQRVRQITVLIHGKTPTAKIRSVNWLCRVP
jgi:hypothetical protein